MEYFIWAVMRDLPVCEESRLLDRIETMLSSKYSMSKNLEKPQPHVSIWYMKRAEFFPCIEFSEDGKLAHDFLKTANQLVISRKHLAYLEGLLCFLK